MTFAVLINNLLSKWTWLQTEDLIRQKYLLDLIKFLNSKYFALPKETYLSQELTTELARPGTWDSMCLEAEELLETELST